jgi:protein gp37
MGEKSNIEWTRSTFNPWWGCTKVSPACDNCYAEATGNRFGTQWGIAESRRYFGDKHWNEPLRWNRKAAEEQAKDPAAQWRVFCASMADVFDNEVQQEHRERLWKLIDDTPHLTWLILTKRISNVGRMIPDRWSVSLPSNVWLGISVVNQEEADRDIQKLLRVKARVRWLSMEPLLGPVDLSRWLDIIQYEDGAEWMRRNIGHLHDMLDWVVVGGESGHNARPMHPDWARSLRDQCAAAGVPFLFKQWGEWAPAERDSGAITMPGQNGEWFAWPGGTADGWRDGEVSRRFSKKAAGRLLDGVRHDGYPEVMP